MTNEMIIMNERLRLMNECIIHSTGNILEFTDEEGKTHQFDEPEEIHTYAFWKNAGRIVRHGSKAIASFPIWCTKKNCRKDNTDMDSEEKEIKMFLKNTSFFTFEQTDSVDTFN